MLWAHSHGDAEQRAAPLSTPSHAFAMSNTSLGLVALASLASAAIGAGAALFVGSRPAPEAVSAGEARPQAAALDAVLARQGELERALEALRTRLEMTPATQERVELSSDQIASAVERWMRENGAQASLASAPTEPVSDASSAARERERRIADAIAKLRGDDLSDSERSRLWKELFEAGLGDQVLAEFEARAEREPNNPDARVDLANAYLQKLFNSPMGPESGVWGSKADKAFDAAIALDANHWDARFGKAVALSNWPAFLGKQPEAIKHFEVLLQQQAQRPLEPRFVNTHLILGNMYMQLGQKDKALATWQAGATQFPDNEALRKQLELSAGG